MKIKTVTYAMLRKGRDFGNDRAECTVELGEGDTPEGAFAHARVECDKALSVGRDTEMRDKLREVMSTEEGRQSLHKFLRFRGKD